MVETFPDASEEEPEEIEVAQPSISTRSHVYLSAAGSAVERELIRSWVRDEASADESPGGPAPDIVEIGTPGEPTPLGPLARRLDGGDDPLLVPVRVVWLPPDRGGERTVRWRDALTFRDPRRPRSREQARIAARHADRFQVVPGEPATLSDLRARHHASGTGAELPAFVVRQALLTLERAERAVIGDRYKVPRLVVEEITSGPRFLRETASLARVLGRPTESVRDQVRASLDELVAVQSRFAMDLFATTMRPFHAKAWNVVADTHDLDALRDLNRRHALVFLPSHRSYADPFVLAEALRAYDFPRNHVIGGANLAFWPMGALARRAGVVFIRRSFRDDEPYKLAVREYFGYLVAKRFNLEWYFEGGRSRTGKLRPPKYGLLRYLAEALLADPGVELHLVPVSITYQHLAEVSAMAAEQRGATKQREGLGWLAKYARTQSKPAGDAVVRFGAPVSMRARLPQPPQPDGDRPVFVGGLDEETESALKMALHKLAFDVAVGINDATPVLPHSAVALTLLGVGDRALTVEALQRLLDPLLRYVEARTIPQTGLPMLHRRDDLLTVLGELERNGVVTSYDGGAEPVYRINPGEYLVAAFYRNNAIHWFVNRAIVELVMLSVARGHGADGASTTGDGSPLDEAWHEALELRDLLKYEFFFPEKEAFRDQLAAELDLIDPKWRERTATQAEVRQLLSGSGFVMAHRVLRSFVEAQLVVADRLAARDPRVEVEPKAFFTECEGMGRQLLMQGRLRSEESLSRELFASALQLAEGRGLLRTGEPDLAERRVAFHSEIVDVVRRIELAEEIDARIASGRLEQAVPWRGTDREGEVEGQ
ncbi:glycerol-3-phosphate 1-O-acyltransferase [Spongisporangium articulatum]|uniref:Glycerol-3-phosphate 1-O-acyltransferase n=1 Tax=Spongisporangium articulatum TaxID=3362603 RepID=A0ABW8ALL5_9ACTN